jgi:hypothetical protein
MTMNLFYQSSLKTLNIAIANSDRDPNHLQRLSADYLKNMEQEQYSLESLILINHMLNQNPKNCWDLFLHKLKNIDFIFYTQRHKIRHLDKLLKVQPQHMDDYFNEFTRKSQHLKRHNCTKTLHELLTAKDTLTPDRIQRIQRFCPKSPNYLETMFNILDSIHSDKPVLQL